MAFELTCYCWNARNLTTQLRRKGTTGHDVPLEIRLSQIIQYIKSWKPHILFILEAGGDAKAVCATLNNSLSDWRSFETEWSTGDRETYIAVIHKTLFPYLQGKFELHGSILDKTDDMEDDEEDDEEDDIEDDEEDDEARNYRRPARLRLSIGKHKVCFLVLHAPSPSSSLDDRVEVISQYAKEWKRDSQHTDYPIILCGDLNIEAKNFDALATDLSLLGYKHVGPFKPESTTPLPTSLRTYKTIMMTGENSGSQPYDQVWFLKSKSVKMEVPAVQAFTPLITLPVIESKFPEWLGSSFQNLAKTCVPAFDPHGEGLTFQKDVTPVQKMFNTYLAIRKDALEYSQLMTSRNLWSLMSPATRIIFSSAKQIIGAVDAELEKWLSVSMNNKPSFPSHKETTDKRVKHAKSMLLKVNGKLTMANHLFRCLAMGQLSVFMANAFEYAISDHIPVRFTLRFED